MNVNHVYRIGSQGWQVIQGNQWVDTPQWPKLNHPALVVLDAGDVSSDVWRFEGKPEYATALIEKRVRTEGLVDGGAHIVVHKLNKSPSGFEVFFSAIPIEIWQRVSSWAAQQADHCIVMTSAGLLCHGLSVGQGRVLVSERQISIFVQNDAAMTYFSAHALGQGKQGMEAAAQVLGANARNQLQAAKNLRVELGGLWTTQGDLAMDGVAEAFTQASAVSIVQMPAATYQGSGGAVESVLPSLAASASRAQALNSGSDRIAWRAESWVGGLASVTALVAFALVGVGIFATQQAQVQRQTALASLKSLEQLEARIQAVNTIEVAGKLVPVAEFAQRLDSGARYDPLELLHKLKTHAGPDIRIQRIKLDSSSQSSLKTYRVDGVASLEASGAVIRLVNTLRADGWSLKAVDPADSASGAFSYELVAMPTTAKP